MRRLWIAALVITPVILTATTAGYIESVQRWQQERNAKLRLPDSWLALAGLFWLKPGDNTIGSASSNDFVIQEGSAPAHIGRLHVEGSKVSFTSAAGTAVKVDGKPIHSTVLLKYDPDDNSSVVSAGSISFYIIERDGKLGLRAKDSQSPVLKSFKGMKYFPINSAFHFDAKFIPEPKKIPILDVLGVSSPTNSPGIVQFVYQGKAYSLRPIFEDQTLFFLYKDPTNKTMTYQAGRMLNTPLPQNGRVDLDFNHSYNPPCTFTPYATCPLPPRENILPIAIDAGELRYGKGHVEPFPRENTGR
ncbi:MAG TPA: DUF1684 domain-containing protein [Bryobacteraceae bacterium]|jgi:hypothetical protein|nr:DUF1684 domain-containing protein [Bryobacteraceae bacterium]